MPKVDMTSNSMTNDVVIQVRGLWKRYGLPLPGMYYHGKRWLRTALRSAPGSAGDQLNKDDSWALSDISLEVRRGETLGIIGRNGAGKSTLLKVLAGVTPASRGSVSVYGRVFPMIELNAGLSPELTGRENALLLGTIMGLPRREVVGHLRDIQEFTELGEWFDKPVRTYSSGMLARLGFGVAVNVRAEVLLIDEVLAVGDVSFQQKCYNRLTRLWKQEGVTILLVSHAYRQVERLCGTVLWLDGGKRVMLGPSQSVILHYMNHLQENRDQGKDKAGGEPAPKDDVVFIREITVLPEGENNQVFTSHSLRLKITFESKIHLPDGYFYLQVFTQDGGHLGATTSRAQPPFDIQPGLGAVMCEIPDLCLLPGVYLLNAGIGSRQLYQKLGSGEFQIPISVVAPDYGFYEHYAGIVRLRSQWYLERT